MINMSIYEYDEKKQREFDREEGREEGHKESLIMLIQKKIIKGKTLESIADDLETTVEEIKPLYDVITACPADTAPDLIIEKI